MMQSSCSIIKKSNVRVVNSVSLNEICKIKQEEECSKIDEINIGNTDVIENIKQMSQIILRKARDESKKIVANANTEAKEIAKKSYEKGYNEGLNNGYEDGSKKGLEEAKAAYEESVKDTLERCEETLQSANKEYIKYLNEKHNDLINLILAVSSKIAMKELSKDDGVVSYLESVLDGLKDEESIIIKCNILYIDKLNEKIKDWKKELILKGEVYVIEDPLMDIGEIVVEKTSGKVSINANEIEENLKKIITSASLSGEI
ncbi:hypothetical protein [Clostridium sp.]|uniref:FliH/SctL family protein n=1 Tax=Clostridium sp. TaxID=1506 RepID=UPI001B459A87|nr:hypothetical protein [Clostridium sp.]MBP3917378.1 hypothetical protein [Clostridium sp.]